MVLEKPHLQKYLRQMEINISQLLEINIDQISIKATTHEKMGIIGKEEAIAAEAIVLLKKKVVISLI